MSVLAGIGAFANLPLDSLAYLERACTTREVQHGTKIFAEGDAADAVYAITSGNRVRIGSVDQNGKALMVEMFGVGEIFGEIGVLSGGRRSAEAKADGTVKLARIPASVFLESLQRTPVLGANLSRLFAHRLRRTFALFRDASFETVEHRLARQLLYLAEAYGRRTGDGIRLAGRFRQADLADLLGATPRSIITVLNRWRADGLVTFDGVSGHITLCNEARLRQLLAPENTA
jgi:CRP/FNR family cyclic AMP-dependent transcriptional regulator